MADEKHRRRALLRLAERAGVLQFGDFVLKSGRRSDYFLNVGAICGGADLLELGQLYADAIGQYWPLPGTDDDTSAADSVQVLFGPAYKGIPLVVAAATALAAAGGPSLPVAYDRKERKTHGEGGALVGAEMGGKRVLLIDDVLSAGTAVRAALPQLRAAGAEPVGVLVAFDRREPMVEGDASSPLASTYVEQEFGIPVRALADATDLELAARG